MEAMETISLLPDSGYGFQILMNCRSMFFFESTQTTPGTDRFRLEPAET